MRNLLKILILIVILPLQSCGQSQKIDLKKFRTDNAIEFDSRNKLEDLFTQEKVESKWIQQVFQNTIITSKDGDFWEGMEYELFSIANINSENNDNWIVAKKIFLIDGDLTEFYLVRVNGEMDLKNIIYLGNAGSVVECDDYLQLSITSTKGDINYFSSCFAGFDETKDADLYEVKNIKTEIEFKQNLLIKRDTLSYIIEEK